MNENVPDNTPIRILHIEDDVDVAALYRTTLERERDAFDIVTETHPREGLDRFEAESFDCVISDYHMPDMNGLELLEVVRERDPNLPFVLLTAKGSEEIASRAISAGVTDYFQKKTTGGGYKILANRIENAVFRYRAERRSKQAFSAIRTATEGISFLDEGGSFIYVNDSYAEMLGYDSEEMLGMDWEELYFAEDLPEIYTTVLPRAREGRWQGKTAFRRRDGERILANHTLSYSEDGVLVSTVRPIPDTEKLERTLSLREQAMDEATVGILITDPSRPDNPIVYANDGFVSLTGYPPDEILGRNCRFLQGSGTRPEPVSELREAIDSGEPATVELRNYRKDGSMFWNRVRIAPLRDDSGEIVNYVGFQEDVTERKQRERRFEAVFNNTFQITGLTDPDGTIREINDTALSLGGIERERESVVGKPLCGTHWLSENGDTAARNEAALETAREAVEQASNGDPFRSELSLELEDETVVLDFSVRPITDEQGVITSLVFEGRDITERKQREAKLRESEARFRQLAENLREVVWVSSPEKDEVEYVNPAYETVWGRTRESLYENPTSFLEAIHPDDRDRVTAAIEAQAAVSYDETYRVIRPNGDVRWIRDRAVPVRDDADNVHRMVGIASDITDRKRRERRISGLNEALTEFQRADDRQTVCDTIAGMAEDRLDLPVAIVALFDENDGELRVISRTELAHERLATEQLLDRDDGIAWEVFTKETARTVDTADSDLIGEDSPAAELFVYPLGRHGVFVCGGPSVGEEFVRTVARNLQVTFDRLDHEATLERREQALAEQNSSLDRLNRINEILRNIDQALVNASTVTEIQTAVCTEFTGSEDYTFSWFGSYDAVDQTLVPQAWSGGENNYLDVIPLSLDGVNGDVPPETIATTEAEPIVVENLHSDPPYPSWREAALRRRYRSAIAIPLVYRGSRYGVVGIYSAQKDAFGELEREVLGELGEMIAQAINTVETRNALVSDESIELEIGVDTSALTLGEFVQESPEREFEFEGVVPTDNGALRVFCTISGDDTEEVIDSAERLIEVSNVQLIESDDETPRFEFTLTDESMIFWFIDRGAIPQAISVGDDRTRIRVEVSRTTDVREFIDRFQAEYANADLLARREQERPAQTPTHFRAALESELTPRQQEVLQTAYFSGYFDTPRRRSGTEVASALDISQPTFSNHLRSSLRNLLDVIYEN